jgi:hypothetical protein
MALPLAGFDSPAISTAADLPQNRSSHFVVAASLPVSLATNGDRCP